MADDTRSPVEQALDLFVYAPVGLALTVRENLPALIAKGRQLVGGQVGMARVIGQFAVAEGGRQARARGKQVLDLLADNATILVPRSEPGTPPAERPAAEGPAPAAADPQPASTMNGHVSAPPSSAHLAIHGYDSLSASQVVQRLPGLSTDELEAVRVYESATRGRRTILSKIAQLQSAS